jgi:cytoskeletal protein CcmA (bactofilin family)
MTRRGKEEKVLDVNATMQGDLVFSDPVNLRINGNFKGNLKTKGVLAIGKEASVNANIRGEKVVISGQVVGNISATDSINLTSGAYVKGDIKTPRLAIEAGAKFNGNSDMRGQLLDLGQLSDYFSIEEDKIMEWVDAEKIPVRREKNKLFFDKDEVEKWMASNQ